MIEGLAIKRAVTFLFPAIVFNLLVILSHLPEYDVALTPYRWMVGLPAVVFSANAVFGLIYDLGVWGFKILIGDN